MSDQNQPKSGPSGPGTIRAGRPLQRRAPAKRPAQRIDRHVATRIRTLRALLGLSQAALAESLGMSSRQLDAYEHGVTGLPATTLSDIAKVLGKPVAWFAGPTMPAGETVDETAAERHARLKDQVLREVPRGFLDYWGKRYRELQTDMLRGLAEAAAAAPAPAAEAPSRRARVLLVDDAPDLLVVLGAFLDGAGLEVVRARNGDQALQIVAGGEPLDAIVTDYAMPGLSGVDLLLQASQLRPGLPGMIVTGFAESAGLDELPATIEVLRKPFRREELVRRVRTLVGVRAAKTTAQT